MQEIGQWLGKVYGVYVRIVGVFGGVWTVGGSGRRFGVQHSKSPSRLFPNTDKTTSPAMSSRTEDRDTVGELALLFLDAGRVEEDVHVLHQAVACLREYVSSHFPKERTDEEHATGLPGHRRMRLRES
jgi:hypothetical protein